MLPSTVTMPVPVPAPVRLQSEANADRAYTDEYAAFVSWDLFALENVCRACADGGRQPVNARDLLAALPAELLGAAQQATFGDGFEADDGGGEAGVDAEDDGDDEDEEEEEGDDGEDRNEEEVCGCRSLALAHLLGLCAR